MPVSVQQVRRTTPLFTGLYPGGVAPDWLLGNVADWKKTELLVRVGQFKESSGNSPITIDCPYGATQSEIGLFDGTWSDEGIGFGDSITIYTIQQEVSVAANYVTTATACTVLGVSSDKKKILLDTIIQDAGGNNIGAGAIFPTPRQEGISRGKS